MKHENDGVTYAGSNKFKCKNCGKFYNDKEEECVLKEQGGSGK